MLFKMKQDETDHNMQLAVDKTGMPVYVVDDSSAADMTPLDSPAALTASSLVLGPYKIKPTLSPCGKTELHVCEKQGGVWQTRSIIGTPA